MKLLKFVAIITVVVVTTTTANDQASSPLVNTPLGKIKGVREQCKQTGKTVYEFRGIPFGKPPVGKYRFKKPLPVEKWTDTLDATVFGDACVQNIPDSHPEYKPKSMSENCLFLNVYVPQTLESVNKLPVMVWIHGGALVVGFSNQYDGGWISTFGNVIVVTINYRLDVFGFLSVDHPAALGNYGLWDQKLALQWVHDNIASFRGDSNKVTIFGQSAGGWSVNFQTLIPSNRGLFQRAIAQSGTVNKMCLSPKHSKLTNERMMKLANRTQCQINDMYNFVDCLRTKDRKELLSDYFDMESNPVDSYDILKLPHSPVIDGDLIKTDIIKDVKDKSSEVSRFFRSFDFITGYTSNEALMLGIAVPPQVQEHFGFNATEGINKKFLCELAIDTFVTKFFNNNSDIKKNLCTSYTVENSQDEQSMKVLDFMNDAIFVASAKKMLEYHSSGPGRTYQYMFSKESHTTMMGHPPKYAKGAGHASELFYMFEQEVILPSMNRSSSMFTEEEKKLSDALISYFTSFAKSGVPDGGNGSVKWKQFDIAERSYLNFDSPISLKQNANPESVEIWQMKDVTDVSGAPELISSFIEIRISLGLVLSIQFLRLY